MLHAKRFREELTCMVQWFLPPPTFLVFFTDALLGSMRLPKTAVSRYKRLREKIRIPKRVTEFPTSDSWILLLTCRSVLSQYFTFMRNRIKLSNQTISWSMDQIMSQRPLPIPVSERPECMSLLLKLFFIFVLVLSPAFKMDTFSVCVKLFHPRSLGVITWLRRFYLPDTFMLNSNSTQP